MNHYLLQKTNSSPKQIQDFCHKLILSSAPANTAISSQQVDTGKGLLSEFRTFCQYYSINFFSSQKCIDVPVLYALVLKLKFLSSSENDNDRKTLRIVLYLIMDSFFYYSKRPISLHRWNSSATEQRTLLLTLKEFCLFTFQELKINVNTERSVLSHLSLPKRLALLKCAGNLFTFYLRNPSVSSLMEKEGFSEVIRLSKEIPSYLINNIRDTVTLSSSDGPKPNASHGSLKEAEKKQLLQVLFSSLRRSGGFLPSKELITLNLLTQLAAWRAVATIRNLLQVIVNSMYLMLSTAMRNQSDPGIARDSAIQSSLRANIESHSIEIGPYMNYFAELLTSCLRQSSSTEIKIFLSDGLTVHLVFEMIRLISLNALFPCGVLLSKRSETEKSDPKSLVKLPSSVLQLLLEAFRLVPTQSAKFAAEAVTLVCQPELSWNVLPLLDDPLLPTTSISNFNIIQTLCASLANHIKPLPLDDATMPVLLRSCEKIGRLLLSRPHFGDHLLHPSHPCFSPESVRRDGEAIIPLWLALRRHYRLSNTPKEKFIGLPFVIKMIGKFQGMDLSAIESRSNWAFDYLSLENPTRTAQGIPSPASYQLLLKACIWMAPEVRYCPKEHEELWTGFALSLFASIDSLSNYHMSCEYLLGDVPDLLVDLLGNFLCRMKTSTFLSFVPGAMQRQISEPSRKQRTSLLDNIMETATEGDKKKKIIPVLPNLHYLGTLCDLASLVTRHALVHRLSEVLPDLWKFVLLLIKASEDESFVFSGSKIFLSHLVSVITLARGANRFQNETRSELLAGLFSVSLFYLTRLVVLLLEKVEGMVTRQLPASSRRSSLTLANSTESSFDRRAVLEDMLEVLSTYLADLSLENSDLSFSEDRSLYHISSLVILLVEKGLLEPKDHSSSVPIGGEVTQMQLVRRFVQRLLENFSANDFRLAVRRNPSLAALSLTKQFISHENVVTVLEAFAAEFFGSSFPSEEEKTTSHSHILFLVLQQLHLLLSSRHPQVDRESDLNRRKSGALFMKRKEFLAVDDVLLFGAWSSEINENYLQFMDLSVHKHHSLFHNENYVTGNQVDHLSSANPSDSLFPLPSPEVMPSPFLAPFPSVPPGSFNNEASVFDQSDVLLFPSASERSAPFATSTSVAGVFSDDLLGFDSFAQDPHPTTAATPLDAFPLSPSNQSNGVEDLFPSTNDNWKVTHDPFVSDFAPTSDLGVSPTADFPSDASNWFTAPALASDWTSFPSDAFQNFPAPSAAAFDDFGSDFASKPGDPPPPPSLQRNPFDSF